MSVALNFAMSLFLSIALVPLSIRYAVHLGLVDKPDGIRKIHTKAIAKSGGLAMAIAFFCTVFYSWSWLSDLKALLFGAVIIVVFGYLDDRYELNYKWKFAGQILAIAVFLWGTPDLAYKSVFGFSDLPHWLVYGVVFVFLLGVSNAINLSDGLDGLAAGMTFTSLVVVAFIAAESGAISVSIIALTLMGAIMGFLRFNTHPAQVFMGDTGSQFIGFTCAGLLVYLSQSSASAISPMVPFLVLALPISDTFMVMAVRIANGKSPFYPDKSHIHHRLMQLGCHHYEAVAVLYVLQIIVMVTAYFIRHESDLVVIVSYLVLFVSCMTVLYFVNLKGWKVRSDRESGSDLERRNLFLRKNNWIYEYSAAIIISWLSLAWLLLVMSAFKHNSGLFSLALLALMLTFAIGIIFPHLSQVSTRIAAYSATVLYLYSFSLHASGSYDSTLLNVVLALMGLSLFLSIRMTRKEVFQLNNHDIIIVLILMVAPLLPWRDGQGMNIGLMLFRLSLMVYAIEYIVSKSKQCSFWLRVGSVITLFVLTFV